MNEATETLHKLFSSEWDYQMQEYPTWASRLGDRRWNDAWENRSLEAIAKRHRHSIEVLAKLRSVERDSLSPSDRLNYDLFEREYQNEIEGHQFGWYLMPLNQHGGIQTANELGDALPFDTIRDYEDWLARLRAFPEYMEQTIALMQEGIHTRIILPRVVLQRIPSQIDHQTVADPRQSRFYKPFTHFPPAIAEPTRKALSLAAEEAITQSIVPAFGRLKEFFIERYLPAAWSGDGIWQLPRGEAMYQFAVRDYTTTDMSPEEIHQIGLAEVRRIRTEMEAVIDRSGYALPFQEFVSFLKDDPQFYYDSPERLLEGYRALTRRIDPLLVKMFGMLPRMPYGVEPIPDNVAADATTAYYRLPAADGSRAGTYFVNLYKPETRPKYEMMALSLHEAVPGHHLQIALAMEQKDLPNFRRYGGYTAFVEGWGLYAESLGDEMGLYDDPYSKFGQLTYEIWRAARLVVDTGLHAMRWERQRAIDFCLENMARPELDIVNEVDRYIAMPGQALAYKIGQLRISAIRAKTREALSSRFDIRAFHDEILKDGALPLDVLEAKMDAWASSQTDHQTAEMA